MRALDEEKAEQRGHNNDANPARPAEDPLENRIKLNKNAGSVVYTVGVTSASVPKEQCRRTSNAKGGLGTVYLSRGR